MARVVRRAESVAVSAFARSPAGASAYLNMLVVEAGVASGDAGLLAELAGPLPVPGLLLGVLTFPAPWAAASSAVAAPPSVRAVLLRDSKKLLLPDVSPGGGLGVMAMPGVRPVPLLTRGLVVRVLLLRDSLKVL